MTALQNIWALREVYFDEEGNPTMHREPTKAEPQEPVEVPSDDVQLDAAKSTAAIAWGWLWHVTTADDRVITARHLLGQMLDKDLKRYGIQNAKDGGAQVNVQEIEAAMSKEGK